MTDRHVAPAQELLDVTRDLLKDLDTQPSAPETDELREKFRIVKVQGLARLLPTLLCCDS